MQIKNQIVSYFIDPSDTPRVVLSPATMNSEVAAAIIKEEHGLETSGKKMLHVCYDKDSKIIYIPNAYRFTKDQIAPLLLAAKYHIVKEWGDYKMVPPIEGSPFSSLRVRSVKSFGYVANAIEKLHETILEHSNADNVNSSIGQLNDELEEHVEEVKDLVVIEANLARMPETVKSLPPIYKNNKNFAGGLIQDNITFIDEVDTKNKRRPNPIRLLTVDGPFILIDISPAVEVSSTEKEWAVLSGYRDYVASKYSPDESRQEIDSFAPLYAAKRYMYLGWPFEEVCKVMLECVDSFPSLITGIHRLILTSSELVDEGYENPAKHPYYLSFRIDPKTFPLKIDPEVEAFFFCIQHYDEKTGYVIIRSSAYVESDLCLKVLKAKSRPYIVKYNPTLKQIDVKVQEGVHKELDIKTDIPSKIKALIETEEEVDNLEFRADKRSRSISLSSNQICHLRNISDYYYAKDHIQKMCDDRKMPFEDIQVVVGPIERIFGQGIQGGFMGAKQFEDSKLKVPHQIEKGLFITPPIIAVNSESMPSYASQTETLIHEYSHKLYSISNPDHEHLYNKDPKLRDRDPRKYWDLYLGDEDEKLAHQEEIRFELASGKSVDEIVRDKVGGAITKGSYKRTYITALKYKEMIDEVVEQMEKEND